MIFTVEISEQADSDLRAIYEYIAFEFADKRTGNQYEYCEHGNTEYCPGPSP